MENFKPKEVFTPKKIKVVDGDTIKLERNKYTFYLRLIGINTPELYKQKKNKSPQLYAIEARDRLGQLIHQADNIKVELHEQFIDATWIRLLGYLYLSLNGKWIDVGKYLLLEGLAIPFMLDNLTIEMQYNYIISSYEAYQLRIGVYSVPGYVRLGRFHSDL